MVDLVVALHVHLGGKLQLSGHCSILHLALLNVEMLVIVFPFQVLSVVEGGGLRPVALVVDILL